MYALATLSYTNLSIIWEQIFLSLYILAKLNFYDFIEHTNLKLYVKDTCNNRTIKRLVQFKKC